MPKRRATDAVHVIMTDHHIQRFQPAGDLMAELPEHSNPYRGEVVRYASPASAPIPEKLDDAIYLAEAQVVESNNLTNGIAQLETAIRKLQPQSPRPYLALADALGSSTQCERAIGIYLEALRHAPTETLILQKMARCQTTLNQVEEAEQTLRRSIAIDPNDAKAWTQLGLLLLQKSRTKDAIGAFEKATEADPNYFEAWSNLGEATLQGGDATLAEGALRTALDLRPNSAQAHSNLATLLAATYRMEEADFQFQAALRYQPDDARIHFQYGMALARARRLPEAQTQLQQSVEQNPGDAESHHSLGLILDTQGNGARAIEEYRSAVQLRPGYALANLSLGWALIRSGRTAEGVPYLKAAAAGGEGPVRDRAQRLLDQYAKP
jgi:tetratricopeptide (TPR) repeat protein